MVDPIKGRTEINLHDPSFLPTLHCTLQCMGLRMACLTAIFSIVDLWQCCVCCTRSGVTRSTHFVALYLFLMCQSTLCALSALSFLSLTVLSFSSFHGLVVSIKVHQSHTHTKLHHRYPDLSDKQTGWL